jgi:hypothetical protein
MKGRLQKSDARESSLAGAVHYGHHQLAAEAMVLNTGINGDGSYAGDSRPLIQAVAAHDASLDLGDDAVKPRMLRKQPREHSRGYFRRGEIRREAMIHVDLGKGFKADSPAVLSVIRSRLADHDCSISLM